MLSTSLFSLPPPATSLLPGLNQQSPDSPYQQHSQHPHHHHGPSRRKQANRHPSTPLASLAHDERLIASRKLAIAMYGYSWLKPAGCPKTMLGRREEELEREEVERQMREVETQERIAAEQEEQERQDELRRQAEGGEVEGLEDRDLDDDVPEAEEQDLDEGEEEGEEEDMDGDLDDDIPDADAEGNESSWVYDTRREPDTESEDEEDGVGHQSVRYQHPRHPHFAGNDSGAVTNAMVSTMLDEDELGDYEHQHDLDDDVPDMDRDLDADVNMDMDMDMDADLSDRDLDGDIPSAEEADGDDGEPGWEHTDSELEESEMDISLLPPHPSSASRNPGTTHEEIRRVSGNQMLPPALTLPPPSSSNRSQSEAQAGSRWPSRQRPLNSAAAPLSRPGQRPMSRYAATIQTPGTDDEVSALISSSAAGTGPSLMGTARMNRNRDRARDRAIEARHPQQNDDSVEPSSPTNRRNWLNPAGARRNLFGGFRDRAGTSTDPTINTTNASTGTQPTDPRQTIPQPATTDIRPTGSRTTVNNASSGGLFTPSPRQTSTTTSTRPPLGTTPANEASNNGDDDNDNHDEEQHQRSQQQPPRSRTRSGRLLGGIQQMETGTGTGMRTDTGGRRRMMRGRRTSDERG